MQTTITVLTSVHINCPERWDYLVTTVESFKKCNLSKVRIIHKLIDDKSPQYFNEIPNFCKQYNIEMLGRVAPENHPGFLETFKRLVSSATTEYILYLEPDHYFYLPYNFITPIIHLYELLPELHQVYLRAPLVYRQFVLLGNMLQTTRKTMLHKVVIDNENSGWVGKGRGHESFSLMPSIFRRQTLLNCINGLNIKGGPSKLERHMSQSWKWQKLVGYLNGQAFCYHIGASGKSGRGNYLKIGDKNYENVWSQKII